MGTGRYHARRATTAARGTLLASCPCMETYPQNPNAPAEQPDQTERREQPIHEPIPMEPIHQPLPSTPNPGGPPNTDVPRIF